MLHPAPGQLVGSANAGLPDCSWHHGITQSSLPNTVVATQAGGGFWLQHSTPKFPRPAAGHAAGTYSGVEHAQRVFGQHFLCLTLGAGGLETVAAALQTAFPLVFSRRIPPELRGTLPQVRPPASFCLLSTWLSLVSFEHGYGSRSCTCTCSTARGLSPCHVSRLRRPVMAAGVPRPALHDHPVGTRMSTRPCFETSKVMQCR